MKVGAEPKKVAIAAGLMVVAAYLMYSNVFADQRSASSRTASAKPPAPPPLAQTPAAAARARSATPRRSARGDGAVREWTPRIGGIRPEDNADPETTDPTLRLDLLARLESVTSRGGHRSLFDFSAAPVTVPDIKVLPKKPETAKAGENPAGESPNPEAEAEKPKPPPPPIPLKFYGYVSGREGRRAFFLNGDDIFAAAEGQLVQSRYKIVKIGTTSAEVEDTHHENNKQSLPIVPEPRGGD